MGITLCRQEIPNPSSEDIRGSETSIMTHLSISLMEELDNLDQDILDHCSDDAHPDADLDQGSLSPRYPGVPIYVPIIPLASRKDSLSLGPESTSRKDSPSPGPRSRPKNDSLSPGPRSRPKSRPRSNLGSRSKIDPTYSEEYKQNISLSKLINRYGCSQKYTTRAFYTRTVEENKFVVDPEIFNLLSDSSFERHEWRISDSAGKSKGYVVAYVVYGKVIKVFPKPQRSTQKNISDIVINPMDRVDTVVISDNEPTENPSFDQLKKEHGDSTVTRNEEFTPRSQEELSFVTKIDDVQITPLSRGPVSKHSQRFLDTPVSAKSQYEQRARRFSWNVAQRAKKYDKENVNNKNT